MKYKWMNSAYVRCLHTRIRFERTILSRSGRFPARLFALPPPHRHTDFLLLVYKNNDE